MHLFSDSWMKLGVFLFLSFLVGLISCSRTQPKICLKDGRQFCVTSDKIQVITWDACYRRGVNCMEGQCWEYAMNEFNQAIDLRFQDQRQVRAYGMHFREEYFPHRELGICYFHTGRTEEAIEELELSMSQTPSARARYYLNQGRRSYLFKTGLDTSAPAIDFACPDFINQTPFMIKGTVRDDQYVASISVNQNPLFIELAEPSISFSVPVDLDEGENRIEIIARDLVDREVRQSITVYLDQQGPLVMVNPIRRDVNDLAVLTAVVYDRSGIASFQLNYQEVERSGLDQLCLIEQTLVIQDGVKAIPFRTEDRAGNITKGFISLMPEDRRSHQAMRLAWNDTWLVALGAEEENIFFDITHPQSENLTTFYQEIFLEARIEAKKGIKSIELNGRRLFDASRIRAVVDQNREELVQKLLDQQKDPEKYIRLLRDVLDRYTLYYLNQRVALLDEVTDLTLLVEDSAGNRGSRAFHIKKIPREEVLKSEQRMIMALLPFDAPAEEREYQLRDYINTRCLESFVSQGRFNLVEREKLPWVLIEKTIREGRETYHHDLAQKIGQMAAAEGVICGFIQKREDGTEILARFVEVETGLIRLFHDVFTPTESKERMDTITSGLAMKFRDSFPICTGTITGRKGKIIRVDFGSETGVFPGMVYNIFQDEQELMARASIREVTEGASEAEITGEANARKIEVGYRVRTR